MQQGQWRKATRACLPKAARFYLDGLQLGHGRCGTLALTPVFGYVAFSLQLKCLQKKKP